IGKTKNILYVSGEESQRQIKLRASRLGIATPNLKIYSETNMSLILDSISREKPDVLIVDSVQTMYNPEIQSTPGNVSQIRDTAAVLMKIAKENGISVFVVGHVTKEGSLAGPKILEHIVDVVLQFEGDSNNIYRILRCMKNRFGSTSEIGVFEMCGTGLREVANPSDILLSHYDEPLSGVAVGAAIDGARPFLIETQALVANATYATPQRSATGFDIKRLGMLLAVLEKRLGLKLYGKDIFLNFAGGFKISDTGLDLAVVASILSSFFDIKLGDSVCFAGEIGLSGEVRPAPRSEQRIAEAARLGFKQIVVSNYLKKNLQNIDSSIEIIYVSRIDQVARFISENR
ncbi:MAG: DNA repair protein RadA, partial [Rikenellaceae bacterium]|nr:DNA repair protein RadA [Rikenellaceae bacterium]